MSQPQYLFTKMKDSWGISFLLVLYNLLILGYTFSWGFYSLAGILTLLGVLIFLLFLQKQLAERNLKFQKTDVIVAGLTLVVSTMVSFIFYGGLYPLPDSLFFMPTILLSSFFLSFLYLFELPNSEKKWPIFNFIYKNKFLLLLTAALTLRILIFISLPNPHIDVFDILRESGRNWWKGKNPYSLIFHQMYKNEIPDHFDYFPVSFLLTTPASVFLNDPRYTFIVAELIIVFILYFLLKPSVLAQIIPLIFLFNPLSPFILEQSYLDPLLVLGFSLFILFYLKKKIGFASFLLGIFLATKQYAFFFLPFLFKLRYFSFRYFLVILGTVFFIVFPFFLWSPKDFVYDTLFYPFNRPFRFDGLTLFSFLHQYFSLKEFPFLIFALLLLLIFFYLYYFQKRTVSAAVFSFSVFLLALFFFREGFANRYYLVSSLLLLSVAGFIYEKQ